MSKRSREEGDRELERRDAREVDGTEGEELQMKKAKNLDGEAELVHASEKGSSPLPCSGPPASWEALPAELRLRLFLLVGCVEVCLRFRPFLFYF